GHSRTRIIAGYQQAVNRLMREQSEEIKIRVLKGLGQWPASIGIKLPVDPAEFLSSDNPGLREMAAGCLYLTAAPQRDALVLQALGDGHPRVRDAAARSLGKASPDSGDIALRWISDNRGTPRAQQSLLGILQQQDLPAAVYECIASQKVDETLQLQDACALLEDRSGRDNEPAALTLVRYTLNERMEQTIQLALLALEPLHEPGIIGIIRAGFSSGDIRHAANACEALCNLDNRHVAGRLHDILQQTLSKQRAENTGMRFKDQAQVLDWCIKEKDEWLQYCARHALQSLAAGDARA
ncbi:MAG: hypothetical protein U9P11_01610, partial [Pseudomonadota bacterium]|nr:hypothetical protein [Pseudomonadota bacterium]